MIKVDLVFLIVTVSSLHLDHHEVNNTYNATNYYNDLDARQNQLKQDMNVIKSQIDQINGILNTSALTSNQKISTLSEGMADERDSLYKIQTYLDMPFEIQPCEPVNLTPEQKQALQLKINNVNSSLLNLENKINVCPECPQVAYYQQILKKQQNYLRVIQATVNSNCLKTAYQFVNQEPTGLVNIAYSIYKDNLKAPNWVYGNITESQYKNYIFPLTTQFNLTSCPLVTPFFDTVSKKCVICRGTFIIGERKCTPCPENKFYNTTIKNCVETPKACPAGTILNSTTNNCDPIVCGEGLKLDLNSSKCVSLCESNQVYNKTTKLCENTCSKGQVYNTSTQKCQPIVCPTGQVFNLDANACLQIVKNTLSNCPPERPTWNSVALRCQECPPDHPVYNKVQGRCEQCPDGSFWNSSQKLCEPQCKSSQFYNWKSKKCESKCPEWQLFNQISKNCENLCNEAQKFNTTTKKCESNCSEWQLYSQTTKKCQNLCSQVQNFNTSTKKCDNKCNATFKWDNTSQKCVCSQGLLLMNNSCVAKVACSQPTPIWNSTSNSCYACPFSTPIAKNGSCQACPSNLPLYSPIIKQCVGACSKGYIWNNSTFACDMIVCTNEKPLLNYTSGKCEGCPNGFVWISSQKTCRSNVTAQCPTSEKPFYNPQTKVCQLCPLGTVYNKTDQLCQSCPIGSHLDSTQTKCVSLQTCETNENLCPKCPEGYVYSHSNGSCIKVVENSTCPSGYIFNSTSRLCFKCQPGTTYNQTLDKCTYIACEGGLFNNITNKCESCPAGSFFDSTKKTCLTCPSGTFFDSIKNSCLTCPNGTFFSSKRNGCIKCPENSSFDVKTQGCLACQQGSIFNKTTGLCQVYGCSTGQYYSLTQKNCTKLSSCKAGQYFSVSTESCTDNPVCKSNQFLNNATKQCQSIPACPTDFYFNTKTGQCQKIGYVTGVNTTNLIYAFNFSNYEQQYSAKLAAEPSTKDCPQAAPYYDRTNKVCVSCGSDRPYFNLHTSLCQNCGDGEYDAKLRQCTKGGQVQSIDPTLERLIMNIL